MSDGFSPGRESEAPPESWDEEVAAALPGSLVVVGFTHLNPDGSLNRHRQVFGYVLDAERDGGITLRLEGAEHGKTYRLPPDTRPFRKAALGQYRLQTTGEVVDDPDFTCTWTVRAPWN